VQVDPVKPKLKAPGTKRLKLESDGLLSNFSLTFNLHCYIKGAALMAQAHFRRSSAGAAARGELKALRSAAVVLQAEAYTRPLLSST